VRKMLVASAMVMRAAQRRARPVPAPRVPVDRSSCRRLRWLPRTLVLRPRSSRQCDCG
jgi:hypothetical protein